MTNMNFDDISKLQESGFTGFVSVAELQQTACVDVPQYQGVYLVVRRTISEPKFLLKSIGGHFKGKNPTIDLIETLRNNWVNSAKVLYIGKAGSLNNNRTLRMRLREFMRFGQGIPVGHWGGRYIWQLADSSSLQIRWKPTSNENPAEVESQLIQKFRQQYGMRPFANLRG